MAHIDELMSQHAGRGASQESGVSTYEDLFRAVLQDLTALRSGNSTTAVDLAEIRGKVVAAVADIGAIRTQLVAAIADITEIRGKQVSALTKLDADAGVTDTNYVATISPAAQTSVNPAAQTSTPPAALTTSAPAALALS